MKKRQDSTQSDLVGAKRSVKTAPKKKPAPKKSPAKVKSEPKKAGRPSDYSPALVETICDRIATGESLRRICTDEDMPHHITVIRWLGKHDDFASRYAHARDIQAQTFVDKMLDVAESAPERNPITGALDAASVAHIRNKIATMQWLAAKLAPKKYGDKLDLNHGGQKDNPITAVLSKIGGSSLPVVPDDNSDD